MTTTSEQTRDYGSKVTAVEPGGTEFIPLAERHGKPIQLLWTWTSPNMEFATIFVGVISVLFFGLSFGQAALAIIIGSGLGALFLGILSTWGPKTGLCQMVLGRSAFGAKGNILPAVLNTVTAGAGWFAVNSVTGALALSALTTMPALVCLVIVVAAMLLIAFFGHNLIQLFERFAFPVLAVIFIVVSVIVLSKSDPGAASEPIPGAFWIALAATFGYAAGWNPYAADYTRYLDPATESRKVGLFAGLGLFISCTLLEIVGAAAVTAVGAADWNFDNPVESFTGLLPTWLGKLTLLGICLGAIAANALNVYSSSLSFTSIGLKLPTKRTRAVVALGLGLAGFIIAAIGIDNIESYEGFLLVIAYWIGPWLGVVLADRIFRRGTEYGATYTDPTYKNHAGPIAMFLGLVISIPLFSNQEKYVGLIAEQFPGIGDLTFEVGFVIAFALYALLFKPLAGRTPATAETASGETPAESVA